LERELPRPNYQREKRLKDIARQQKQEEKRNRRLQKPEPSEGDALPQEQPESSAGEQGKEP
jgi:hypothetical protein